MKKITYILFIVASFFSTITHAQRMNRDPISVEFSQLNFKGDQNFSASLGAPPIRLGSYLWIHRLSTSRTLISPVQLSQLRYSSLWLRKLNASWSMTLGFSVSSQNAAPQYRLNANTLFGAGFAFFSLRNPDSVVGWTFGLVIPDRSSPMPIIPGVGFNTLSADQKVRFIFGFPILGVLYRLDSETILGLRLSYQRDNYSIKNPTSNEFIGLNQFSLGSSLRRNITGGLWGTLTAGYSFLNEVSYRDANYEKTQVISNRRGPLLTLGLSYRFGPQ